MNRVLSLAILGVLVVLLSCANMQSVSDVPRISKEELKPKLGSPGVVLLDVRTAQDWANSDERITGALRMDPQAVDAWATSLSKDKEIVLYCA